MPAVMMRALLVLAILFGATTAAAQGARPGAAAPPPPPAPAANLIDLNTASRDDLMTLEGIGEVRADAIVRARPFKAKTELVERRLIPESLYDRISDKVMARPPPAPPAPARTPPPSPQRRS
jgi:competence protein ComEA